MNEEIIIWKDNLVTFWSKMFSFSKPKLVGTRWKQRVAA